jgi:hypothetical protein
MADTIKIRLRADAYHYGKRIRRGAVIAIPLGDLIDGRLPNWAETCDETDQDLLARHINASDADRQAAAAKKEADKAIAAAAEATAKVESLKKKAEKAAEVASKAQERKSVVK